MLDRYVLKEFLKYLFGATILFSGIGMIAKVVESLKYINNYQGDNIVIFEYYLYSLPAIILIITAPAFLFAICYVVFVMLQNREFVVICSSGRSQKRILMPIVLFSFLFSVLFFCFNQFIAYPSNHEAYKKFNTIKGVALDHYKWADIRNYNTRFKNYYFFISHFLPKEEKIFDLHISIIDENHFLKKIIEAEEAKIIKGEWLLNKAMVISFDKGKFKSLKKYKEKKENIPVNSAYFQRFYLHNEIMNVFQLVDFIKRKKDKAHPTAMYITEYYWHFSFPLICFFFVLIGAVVALKIPGGSLALSLAIALLFGMAYFLVMFYAKFLGKFEILHPFIAGSLANLIVGVAAVFFWFRYTD